MQLGLCCFCDHHCFVCSFGVLILLVFGKAFVEFGSFLLLLDPKHMTLQRSRTLAEGHSALL